MKRLFAFLLCLCLLAGSAAPLALAEEEADAAVLVFSTTDREDEIWEEDALGDYKLTMINFWEPWCPPCVREMPELEKLYEDYQERGFLLLGVYSTPGMEDDVDEVLAACETTYPILHYVEAFDEFQTGYVPTTIFVNGEGEVIGETIIGSRSYEDWESLITAFDLLDEEPVPFTADEDDGKL